MFARPVLLLVTCGACAAPGPRVALPLASAEERQDFEFTDENAFRWTTDDGAGCLELHGASAYEPPHRSPLALALLRGPAFADFVLTVQAKQTGREYPHRDLVFVFAYHDAAHFAYAHLASAADPNAHQIMLVDGADRRPVTSERTGGVQWGDGWHTIEVGRAGTRIEVRFDGTLALAGEVPAGKGRVGVGSFDDTGRFRELVIVPR